MTSPNPTHDDRMDDFRRLLRPIYDRADRRREIETAEALNAWGDKEAAARPLRWEVRALDAWEPARGSRWVGFAEDDVPVAEIPDVLRLWAEFLQLEPRGDVHGDGSLTYESPKGADQHVEVWGITDPGVWAEVER